jgi:protein TonB
MLRAERNAGQLLLSWNREAALVKTASRAVLVISDGDHREDVELDLGQLRNGSIVYSPSTNDVSFRLEVTDARLGKSLNESVRVLAGRPSPTPPTSQTGPPRATTPAGDANPKQEPAPPAPVPGRPGDGGGGDSATAGETPSATPTQPPKSMAPIPAAGRGAESLVARITQSPKLPLPPPVESQAQPTSSGAVGTVAGPAITPPPAVVKETPEPAPPQPVGQLPAVQPPPAAQPPPAPAAPQEPLKVGGNVQEAKLIRRITPVYPPLARQARVTGVVRVEATIGKDGKIAKVSALSGPPLLRQAATDSVRQWIYQPSLLNGQPVEVVTQVDVSFNLGR